MESPESWNALTASLAVSDLKNPHAAWTFIAIRGFVRDDPGDRDSFVRFVREEEARGEITGPTIAHRVAEALVGAGIVRPSGMRPDPWGRSSSRRRELIASWNAEDRA